LQPGFAEFGFRLSGGLDQADKCRAGRQLQFAPIDKQNQHRAPDQRIRIVDLVAGNAHFLGQPEREIDHVAVRLAHGKLGAVFRKRDRIRRRLFVEIGALLLDRNRSALDQRAVRHRMQPLEHVRAGLGMRQQGLVAQGRGGELNVAFRHVLEVEADQVHHAVQGEFEVRPQIRRAEIIGDLHHALRQFLLQAVQPVGRDHVLHNGALQRPGKKRPGVDRNQ
jgi:hypothetical protein